MPEVQVYVDVDLDDFDTEDLIEELEGRGYAVVQTAKGEAADIGESFNMVEHLAICGLQDAAREEAVRIASKAIGRPL
jgi:hypothetical protein